MNTVNPNRKPQQLDLFDKSQSQLDLDCLYTVETNEENVLQSPSLLKSIQSDIIINSKPTHKFH